MDFWILGTNLARDLQVEGFRVVVKPQADLLSLIKDAERLPGIKLIMFGTYAESINTAIHSVRGIENIVLCPCYPRVDADQRLMRNFRNINNIIAEVNAHNGFGTPNIVRHMFFYDVKARVMTINAKFYHLKGIFWNEASRHIAQEIFVEWKRVYMVTREKKVLNKRAEVEKWCEEKRDQCDRECRRLRDECEEECHRKMLEVGMTMELNQNEPILNEGDNDDRAHDSSWSSSPSIHTADDQQPSAHIELFNGSDECYRPSQRNYVSSRPGGVYDENRILAYAQSRGEASDVRRGDKRAHSFDNEAYPISEDQFLSEPEYNLDGNQFDSRGDFQIKRPRQERMYEEGSKASYSGVSYPRGAGERNYGDLHGERDPRFRGIQQVETQSGERMYDELSDSEARFHRGVGESNYIDRERDGRNISSGSLVETIKNLIRNYDDDILGQH